MKTAAEYLDAIKDAKSIDSDYRLGKITGFSKQTISRWRTGTGHFDEDSALRVAELLEIDPAQVLIDAAASRMHSPKALRAWESVLSRIGVSGAALAVGLSALLASPPAEAATVCIMSTKRGRNNGRFSGLLC